MELSRFHGKRIAIVLNLGDRLCVFRGTASYERDPTMGNVLRIGQVGDWEEDGNPEFVIQERTWRDEFLPDTQHGCDYFVCVDARAASKLLTS